MGLRAFKKFQELIGTRKHYPREMGFPVSTGTINHFSSRMRVARSFRGIELEDYSQSTISGYNALFQVFLTHSALELFLEISGFPKGMTGLDNLEPTMNHYDPEKIVTEFKQLDPEQRFYGFISSKTNKGLRDRLESIMDGENNNVSHLSAAIRHIFVHGYLTAHANGVRPKQVDSMCQSLSDFLLEFMDNEFSTKVEQYYALHMEVDS